MLLRGGIIVLALILAWFFGTPTLSRLAGRVAAVRLATLPTSPLDWNPSRLKIGDVFIYFHNYDRADTPSMDLHFYADAGDRVFLSSGGRTFPLGVRAVPDPHGLNAFEFAPDPGDQLTLTAERGVLAWPTPFENTWMFGASSPSWRRHKYFHLIWTKLDGDKLEIVWRFEQAFFRSRGWDPPTQGFATLVRADIRSVTPTYQQAIADYLLRNKGWKPADYRIEQRSAAPGTATDTFAVIFLADIESVHPGGGQSINLVVDRITHRIVKEIGFQ
jgi:hypothetical protein